MTLQEWLAQFKADCAANDIVISPQVGGWYVSHKGKTAGIGLTDVENAIKIAEKIIEESA